MSNIDFHCKCTIVITQHPCHLRMAKGVSLTVKIVNSVTSNCVHSFNLAMWAFASMCCPIELVPCSDGWQRTWWQTIHMITGLPLSSIPPCKSNHYEDAWLDLFEAIWSFQCTVLEAHQASKTICEVCISKIYFSHWNPPGVSERMWRVNLEPSISGEY